MALTALTLEQLNAASPEQALQWLDGLYEHSPWIAEAALKPRIADGPALHLMPPRELALSLGVAHG